MTTTSSVLLVLALLTTCKVNKMLTFKQFVHEALLGGDKYKDKDNPNSRHTPAQLRKVVVQANKKADKHASRAGDERWKRDDRLDKAMDADSDGRSSDRHYDKADDHANASAKHTTLMHRHQQRAEVASGKRSSRYPGGFDREKND
jgi:hypothetical protein